MGWGFGINAEGREVGYNVRATCDEESCLAKIDRGLAYACGNMHDGGDWGCGKYFCGNHLFLGGPDQMCKGCQEEHSKLNYRECRPGVAGITCSIHEDQQTEHEALDWDECNDEDCDYHDEVHANSGKKAR